MGLAYEDNLQTEVDTDNPNSWDVGKVNRAFEKQIDVIYDNRIK
jgi:hypothetical protein